MQKIIITGDLLRPNEDGTSHQEANIGWFYHLINWQLSQAVKDADIRLLLWNGHVNSFHSKKFYESNALDICVENWAKLFSSDVMSISESSVDYFRKFFDNNTIVVGFELPDLFIKLLNNFNIPYIDFTVHPVRFIDDIFFGIRTNDITAFNFLEKYAIKEEHFYIQANLHKATIFRMPQLKLEHNSSLLVGQTKSDKSLIGNGRMLSLLDYLDELEEISKEYRKIYFKPHPYTLDIDIAALGLEKRPYIELINENIYKLLCNEDIKETWSISSSVIYESRFWGKKGNYLYKNSLDLYSKENSEYSPWRYVSVYDEFYDPAFWSGLLKSLCHTHNCLNVRLPIKPSRLRISCQAYWGYDFLDRNNEARIIDEASNIACEKAVSNLKNRIYNTPIIGRLVKLFLSMLRQLAKFKEAFRLRS